MSAGVVALWAPPNRIFSPEASRKLSTILKGPTGLPAPPLMAAASVQDPGHRDAMKIGERRVDHAHVGRADELQSLVGFILSRAVQPHSIQDQVVGGSAGCDRRQRVNDSRARQLA